MYVCMYTMQLRGAFGTVDPTPVGGGFEPREIPENQHGSFPTSGALRWYIVHGMCMYGVLYMVYGSFREPEGLV